MKIEVAKSLKKEVTADGYVFAADCTFFGRAYGFIVFRALEIKKNVYVRSLMYETVADYQRGRMAIQRQGFKIKAIVLDGRPGVRAVFSDIPIQMCHFHQKQLIQRYLTLHPKLDAGIELKAIVDTLTVTTEKIFTSEFIAWCDKWNDFLKERTVNPITKRWSYTHKKVRSARRSLRNNLPFLFTYLRYPELNIPNTTNSLEGNFSWLKQDVNIHRGITRQLRDKIIEHILGS